MGVLIPVGSGQATFVARAAGATKNSTWSLGYDSPTPGDPTADAEAIFEAISNGSTSPYNAANIVTGWSFLGVDCTWMDDTGPLLGSFFQTVIGTNSTNPMPLNCAILCNKTTAVGGRKGRGRMFLPPTLGTELDVDGAGNIAPSAVAVYQSYITKFRVDLVAAGYTPLLLHSEPGAPTPINSFAIQGQIATQRRRMR